MNWRNVLLCLIYCKIFVVGDIKCINGQPRLIEFSGAGLNSSNCMCA